jgi:hypothetical protein
MGVGSAIVWIALFSLAFREVVVQGRRDGFGDMRFLTRSAAAVYALTAVGSSFGTLFAYLALKGMFTGAIDTMCPSCEPDKAVFASEPIAFVVMLVAFLTLALTMFFIVFLARNSLRAIREGKAS